MRVAHVMAGAPQGGAELFFERLVLAQHAAGDEVLPVIRTDAGRAARLATVHPRQLPFGGLLDLSTRPRLSAALQDFAPRVAVAWMNRAARFAPRGDWVLAGRLGGYYDLHYYRRCDHLVGNTRTLVRWMRRRAGPPRARTTCRTSPPTCWAPRRSGSACRPAAPWYWRSAACTATRRSTC